jgi:protein TonB
MALGLSVSLALHGVAAAAMTFAVAWRAMPALPSEVAYTILWQDGVPPATPRTEHPPEPPRAEPDPAPPGSAAIEGSGPADAPVKDAALPLPTPDATPDTVAEPAPAGIARPGTGASSLAALLPHPPLPEPPIEAGEPVELPLPPPLPPAPAPRRDVQPARPPRTAPVPAVRSEAAAFAMPSPAPPALDPAAAPLVSGVPRFRRPPPPPDYPARARDRGEEGSVALRLLVDAEGATREIRIQRSSGNRLLDEAAIAAARRWEVEPALIGGRRAVAWVEVPVRFRLEE